MIVRALLTACLMIPLAMRATGQDPGPMIDVGPIDVPEGDTDELLSFLGEIDGMREQLAREYQSAMSTISEAQSKVSQELLNDADALSNEQFATAAKFGLAHRVRGLRDADVEEQQTVLGLVKRQLEIASADEFSRSDLSNASTTAGYLERYGEPSLALDAYRTFAALFKESKNTTYRRYAERFESSARKLELLGNPIELNGDLVDGSELDWQSYRGKVVLVDFWATWCGPCLAEAPNVRHNYDLYRDRGFDVVAISLDNSKSALESYIEKKDVPWVNLFKEGAGWKHPMATKYGINAIPSVFLVNREGDVISLRARGEELGKLLSELLDNDESWKGAIENLSSKIESEEENADLFARRAVAYAATEQWDLALKDNLRAAELDPTQAAAIAKRYRDAGREDDADPFEQLSKAEDDE